MPAQLVIQLIAQVGWPAAQYLISRWSSKTTDWTSEDSARVSAIINTPFVAYEAGVVPLTTVNP